MDADQAGPSGLTVEAAELPQRRMGIGSNSVDDRRHGGEEHRPFDRLCHLSHQSHGRGKPPERWAMAAIAEGNVTQLMYDHPGHADTV